MHPYAMPSIGTEQSQPWQWGNRVGKRQHDQSLLIEVRRPKKEKEPHKRVMMCGFYKKQDL